MLRIEDKEHIRQILVSRLMPLDPEKIILFGSYAWGRPNAESDIDLYIVTKDDFMPRNWREKNEVYSRFMEVLDELQTDVPIDLIVHTRPMHEKFLELDSMFCRKVMREGVVLS
ncbi:nucleotidyltransferase domain-containing protein [Geoalkalibacter halelectricus]|uniref:Nucleotidyltransferase domain-containing protein n=1 Tax=Geoalkalibacter halelectricus TaxID=2847045 RepID=A0ABY5ZN62_9BACT|nr:nucleotidyltransferase domain-containing protein [Geoalkalibacter halelectricus]MDO3379721.1 nucleotidyltransferase domain-containing protein [Geoalkalibacter halelectricus]UWZ79255.1 nucleotidyltransferase domain-containing protein [Geoalkalibacter halelectricus]